MQLCLSSAWGGLEISALRYAKLLKEYGHQTFCAGLADSPLAVAAHHDEADFEAIPRFPKWKAWSKIRALRQIIIRRQVDVIFVHHLQDLWFLRPAIVGLNVRVVGLAHVLLSHSKRDLLHWVLYSALDRLIVFTDLQRDLTLPFLPVPKNRYVTIPGFVDIQHFTPAKRSHELRQTWGVAPEECLIGTIGRLDEQKGQIELVEALGELQRARPDLKWKAVLIGAVTANEEGKHYPERVRLAIEKNGLQDKVKLLSFFEDPSAAAASLDVFVLPSYRETFGLVILEAMASGVPPIVTNVGGPPEIVGDTGATIRPRNVPDLTAQLVRLVSSPDERSTLANRALTRARSNFSRDVVGRQLDQLIAEIRQIPR